jgi:hypothetical protein
MITPERRFVRAGNCIVIKYIEHNKGSQFLKHMVFFFSFTFKKENELEMVLDDETVKKRCYLALVQQRVCPCAWEVDEAVSEGQEGDSDRLEHGEMRKCIIKKEYRDKKKKK